MKSRKEAIESITLNSRIINGTKQNIYDCYLGTVLGGRQIRFSCLTKEALVKKIDNYYRRLRVMGDATSLLPPAQIYDASEAFRILSDAGFPKRTLTSIALDFVSGRTAKEDSSVPVKDCYEKYVSSFRPEQKAHLQCIRTRVGKWMQFFGPNRLINEVSSTEFEQFLAVAGKGSDTTYNNMLTYCKSFFEWCRKSPQCYLSTNPLADMQPKKIAYEEPEYANIEDVRKIFAALDEAYQDDITTYAVLAFFCGVRFEEICRMSEDPSAFILEDDTIRISKPKGWLQGMTPRVIHVTPNAKAWLLKVDAKNSIRDTTTCHQRKKLHQLMKSIGVKISHNIARHSFITYHVAAFGDPAKTEAMAGTSAAMRVSHYMGLATKAQGEAYFNIFPR